MLKPVLSWNFLSRRKSTENLRFWRKWSQSVQLNFRDPKRQIFARNDVLSSKSAQGPRGSELKNPQKTNWVNINFDSQEMGEKGKGRGGDEKAVDGEVPRLFWSPSPTNGGWNSPCYRGSVWLSGRCGCDSFWRWCGLCGSVRCRKFLRIEIEILCTIFEVDYSGDGERCYDDGELCWCSWRCNVILFSSDEWYFRWLIVDDDIWMSITLL